MVQHRKYYLTPPRHTAVMLGTPPAAAHLGSLAPATHPQSAPISPTPHLLLKTSLLCSNQHGCSRHFNRTSHFFPKAVRVNPGKLCLLDPGLCTCWDAGLRNILHFWIFDLRKFSLQKIRYYWLLLVMFKVIV
jgi:hypothetical protein